MCTKTWRFYFSKVPPITCSNNFPSFFRGPVTINMGLGLWKCSDGPVKSATGPWSRWRAHIFTDGGKTGEIFYGQARAISDGPTKKWRKNIQKSLFWACYRWNFGKIKTSRFLYTLGASFSAKRLQLHSSFKGYLADRSQGQIEEIEKLKFL